MFTRHAAKGYTLKWDDETQMGVNAHAALLSQFAKAGGFFDRLVETCPMQLTSNNAPEVRDLIATVMVSMVNGATRFRHFDPTVKPIYGHQEGAEFGYNPQKPGRPSHCHHTLCIAKLRLTLAVVVHPGNETSGTHSRSMLAEYLEFVSAVKKPRLARGTCRSGTSR